MGSDLIEQACRFEADLVEQRFVSVLFLAVLRGYMVGLFQSFRRKRYGRIGESFEGLWLRRFEGEEKPSDPLVAKLHVEVELVGLNEVSVTRLEVEDATVDIYGTVGLEADHQNPTVVRSTFEISFLHLASSGAEEDHQIIHEAKVSGVDAVEIVAGRLHFERGELVYEGFRRSGHGNGFIK